MQIVIPSRKRSHLIGQRSLALFPDALVTVDESEMNDYAPVCKRLLPHPPLPTVAAIHNWIIEHVADDVVVVADDDILKVLCFTGRNTRIYKDPASVWQIIANCAEMAQGMGARFFGFTDSASPLGFKPHNPLSFVDIIYTVAGYIGKAIRNDPLKVMQMDLDTTLNELLTTRIVCVDTRFHFDSVAPLRQSGGNTRIRSAETLKQQTAHTQRKWGQYVKAGPLGDVMLNKAAIQRRQARVR